MARLAATAHCLRVGDIVRMIARPLLALALLLFAIAGCGGGEADPAALEAAAGFRYNARGIYLAILAESCPPDRALDRPAWLTRGDSAMRRFEEQAGSGAVRFQLDVARSDAIYLQAHCRDKSNRLFFQSPMSENHVKIGVREMQELAPLVARLPHKLSEVSPERGVEFRAIARQLVAINSMLCPSDRDVEEEVILAPANAEFRRFRQRLQGSPFAVHFDMAEADIRYDRTITSVDCVQPGVNVAAEVSRRALEETRRRVKRLRAMAGV
jgi:hypothetical protein